MLNSHSIWVKLNRYPPVLVRLLAKADAVTTLTDSAIQERSKGLLSLADIKRFSYATSWDDVPVAKMKAFVQACGVDFACRETMRTLNRYLSRDPQFIHLTRDPRFSEYKDMLREFYRHERARL